MRYYFNARKQTHVMDGKGALAYHMPFNPLLVLGDFEPLQFLPALWSLSWHAALES